MPQRSFKNDSIYQEGRVIVSGRMQRAVTKKSSFGREVQQALWTGVEYATLQLLHSAGAIVPQPLHSNRGCNPAGVHRRRRPTRQAALRHQS